MPSSPNVRLSDEAKDDLRDVLQYTPERWGDEQYRAYASVLDDGIATLAAYPFVGRALDEIAAGLRSRVIREHVVYYMVSDVEVVVLRIVHQRRSHEDLF